jgi:hypothetical protein
MRHASAPCKATQKQRPRDAGKIRVHDKDPADMSWETDVKIRAMRTANDAEDDRHQPRGSPRAGAALLPGRRYGGECGHKLMGHYNGGTLYLCTALRQTYGVPVCQHIPADWIDAAVVAAFFQALSPLALEI